MMSKPALDSKILIFDTTLRDGELTPDVKMNVHQKLQIAELLEAMHVDVIEVGYPGAFEKDVDEIVAVSKQIKETTICALASSNIDEINSAASALKSAVNSRINVYTPVNLKHQSTLNVEQMLNTIRDSVALARNHCADVEWSAFDAARSEPDFLCKAVEIAIASGATTVCIPDSMGTASKEDFAELIATLVNRVSNIEQATIAVHCHDDLGLAVANSLAALNSGARQIECAINGLGARKGNADLEAVVSAIANHSQYSTAVEPALIDAASKLVSQVTAKAISH